jgi:hypothetical protein
VILSNVKLCDTPAFLSSTAFSENLFSGSNLITPSSTFLWSEHGNEEKNPRVLAGN